MDSQAKNHRILGCIHVSGISCTVDFFAGADDITKERESGIEITKHTLISYY